uniref:Cycloidea-like protein n=1 Tax=Berkheya purpurea TaxID=496620 RepID=A0A346D3J8_9ASTR|nr:cycloidea-like protein [Berkheya purpurea]
MFSSNPFPELPSSPNVFLPPNFLFDHEKDCVCFNYHQSSDPFISDNSIFHAYNNIAPPSPIMENNKQDFVRHQQQFSEGPVLQSREDRDDLLDLVISCSKNKTGALKKDGHSKIYTARGPRDRRVRLSIEISRKFFSLQDLLGFDKASKILDWLFNNSKNAIKELVEETNHCSSSTMTDHSKVSFLEAIKGGLDEDKGKKKSSLKDVDDKRKKMTRKTTAGLQENLARDQSKVMARARARERTREKMQIKNLDNELKTLVPDDFNCQVSPSN